MRPQRRGLRVASLALAAFGWAVSAYLLVRSMGLRSGEGEAVDLCRALFGSSCDATLLSPAAVQLGVPLAGWGVMFFALVGLLVAIDRRAADRGALLLAAAGSGAGVQLAGVLLLNRMFPCPLCLAAHLLSCALLVCLWMVVWRAEGGAPQEGGAGKGPSKGQVRWGSWAMVALAGGGLVQGVLLREQPRPVEPADEMAVLAAFRAEPVREISVDAETPQLGPEDAAITLVVFSSFQCPGCAQFAEIAHHLVRKSSGNLRVAFKHYPLSSQCNPAVGIDLQPRSCQAAEAAEAARIQGAFWPFHDALFGSDLSATEEQLRKLAEGLDLDVARFDSDRVSEEVRSRVAAGVTLGNSLGIRATPAVYLDGRKTPSVRLQALELLIAAQTEQ